MKKSLHLSFQREAFTLIELLTVIAIIAVLMGLLFPAVLSVKESARKTQAKNDAAQIVTAVKAYNTEYGMYPLQQPQLLAGQGGYDTVYGDPKAKYPNDQLFDVLRNVTNGANKDLVASMNPKQIVFFEGNLAKDAVHPKSGFASTSAKAANGDTIKTGTFVDPWGNPYAVFIDASYDNSITSNGGGIRWFYYVDQPDVNLGAGACSLGKDGKWGTNGNGKLQGSDDVATWQ